MATLPVRKLSLSEVKRLHSWSAGNRFESSLPASQLTLLTPLPVCFLQVVPVLSSLHLANATLAPEVHAFEWLSVCASLCPSPQMVRSQSAPSFHPVARLSLPLSVHPSSK